MKSLKANWPLLFVGFLLAIGAMFFYALFFEKEGYTSVVPTDDGGTRRVTIEETNFKLPFGGSDEKTPDVSET